MILGAGISQVPLILQAKQMGHDVIVISRKGNYPGLALADKVHFVDTTDAAGIVEIAKEEQIDGVCTTGTDVAVRSVGHVADTLGLKGVSVHSAQLCSDKLMMKRAFLQHGVRTAEFSIAHTLEDAVAAFHAIGPPVMFKAVDSGASKGIVRVNTAEEIEYAYAQVKKATKQPYFVVEQYIEGTEFGAQAFVHENKIQFLLPHGDMMFYGDSGVPIGHYVPFEVTPAIVEDIEATLKGCIEALQLTDCAINADFMLRNNQIYVLEIGARAGATCLPELVSTYYGFNYYEQMIKAALGEQPAFTAAQMQACACELMTSPVGGQLVRLENGNPPHSDIIDISFDYAIGDQISAFRVGTDRIGQIIVKGSSAEAALQALEDIKRNLYIETNEMSGG
ncbi:ATP-grasp domain-containing protein [Paenibacillaceae bacterium]|nr:ATP-grasp domain-containing protein [Paenibacillaceae bacterium]